MASVDAGVRAGGPQFDDYVAVDWSARSVPATGRDSIWLAHAVRRGARWRCAAPENPPTRRAAVDRLAELLDGATARGRRVLAGFDFSFGYPAGLADAFPDVFGEGPAPAWARVWRTLRTRITDDDRNANNRWEVAAGLNLGTGTRLFWGCPPAAAGPGLGPRDRPLAGLAERPTALATLRVTERWAAAQARRPVQPGWKLLGAGSVGSQVLLGLPHLDRLRRQLPAVAVWPLATGWAPPPGPGVTVVELWPTLLVPTPTGHPVRDAAQVLGCAAACAAADQDGRMARWLDPGLDAATGGRALEEGWILGVTAPGPSPYAAPPGQRASTPRPSPSPSRSTSAPA